MAPQRWKVPISIVAVNHIEVIDHIEWLHNELAISIAEDLNHLSSHADFSYVILFFYSLIWFANVRKWTGGYFIQANEQFENFSFFIKVSDEEKFLFFQYGEITVNQRCCLIGMLDARMRFYDNIDPNWAIEVCKWSVTITICSFPYIGKSTELDYVRKSAHEVICGSNHPP